MWTKSALLFNIQFILYTKKQNDLWIKAGKRNVTVQSQRLFMSNEERKYFM